MRNDIRNRKRKSLTKKDLKKRKRQVEKESIGGDFEKDINNDKNNKKSKNK